MEPAQLAEDDGFAYRVPVDAWRPDPAIAVTALEALAAVADRFGLRDGSAAIWPHGHGGGVLLFGVEGRRIHVVGDVPLADELRELLLSAAVPGWSLHPLPLTQTPLTILRPVLTTRYYHLLDGAGFTTVEEVAATPDLALMDLRNAGPKFIAAVRAAVPHIDLHAPSPGGVDRAPLLPEPLDPIVEAIGQVVAAAARMEWLLVDLHESLLQSPRGHIVVAGEGFDTARQACLALANDLDPAVRGEIHVALKAVTDLWQQRGAVVHGVWLAAIKDQLPGDIHLAMRMRRPGQEVRQWTVPELRRLARNIDAITNTLREIDEKFAARG